MGMKEEIVIRSTLKALLNVLDARAFVTIYTGKKNHYSAMPVMGFLCNDELMRLHGEKKVIGIAVMLGTISIQLEY